MRIALTGSHRTGKSTLAASLAGANPSLISAGEPYYHLKQQGYSFSNPLSLDDLFKQLELSIQMLAEPAPFVVFDRCPIDFIGYIVCHRDAKQVDFGEWIPRVQESLRTLNLLVRVPIEMPDRIGIPPEREGESRMIVDRAIKELLASGIFKELEVPLLTVTGTIDDRVRDVLRFIKSSGTDPFAVTLSP